MARKAAAQVTEEPQIEYAPAPLIGPVEVDITEEPDRSAEPTVVETAPEPSPPPQPEPPKPAEDSALMRRVQESEAAKRQSDEIARQAQETLARSKQEEAARYWQSQRQVYDAQYDAIVNSLGAAQAELTSAKTDLKVAGAEGNWDLIAELQERIGMAASNVQELNRRKDYMENWAEQQRQAAQRPQQPQQQPRQQQPQQRAPTVEEVIVNSGLPERAQNWLRQHPDYLTDPVKNRKLQVYHDDAVQQTGESFTEAYYDRVEEMLGMKSGGGQSRQSTQSSGSGARYSAPPTREAPSMSTGRAATSTKVTLTAEERKVAASIRASYGLDKMTQKEAEQIYAKNKMKMQQDKANGSG